MTTFCYGCNVGPSQTARSLEALDRRQVSWLHRRHISEAGLQAAITTLIDAYTQFALPKFWGSGQRASVDGTKWDMYEQNLLAGYHIRYGGYGSIGYYHVSDTYIALFSHFIPCGVWEAVYILDGLLNNASEMWLAFGGKGVISSNDRDEQRKFIKYNHLVANCLILYNLFEMSHVLHQLMQEGHTFSEEAIASLSPYLTEHVNRFGHYHLDLERRPPDIQFDVPIVSTTKPLQGNPSELAHAAEETVM